MKEIKNMATKEADLVMLEELVNIFEMEMDCDGYGIERLDDVPYHFIIEDYELMGWDYVHGAKRLIEYFFDSCSSSGDSHSISVEAEFSYIGTRHVELITGQSVEAPLMDIKFIVK